MAIIVDDSESVWEHVGNLVIIGPPPVHTFAPRLHHGLFLLPLLLAEPYVFHAGQPDVNNGPGGAPLTGGKHTKSEVR